MKTPVEILLAVVGVGGRLGIVGDKLRMLLPVDCPAELKDAIRQHKVALLELLRLDFLIVRSELLSDLVIWTPDQATKETLTVAGADPGNVYTAVELDLLVRRRVTEQELLLLHAAKNRFGGNVTEP